MSGSGVDEVKSACSTGLSRGYDSYYNSYILYESCLTSHDFLNRDSVSWPENSPHILLKFSLVYLRRLFCHAISDLRCGRRSQLGAGARISYEILYICIMVEMNPTSTSQGNHLRLEWWWSWELIGQWLLSSPVQHVLKAKVGNQPKQPPLNSSLRNG
jgi:hypothetical protein